MWDRDTDEESPPIEIDEDADDPNTCDNWLHESLEDLPPSSNSELDAESTLSDWPITSLAQEFPATER